MIIMNWREFKDWVENQGVTNDMEIEDIDMCYSIDTKELNIDIYDKNFIIY